MSEAKIGEPCVCGKTIIVTLALCLLPLACGFGNENTFTQDDLAWWAIQPVVDPTVPPQANTGAIDAFVLRQLDSAGLAPAPQAGAEEFVRRAYFDLHGLPPTPEQVDAFRAAWQKDADAAVAALIDELLASPRYGERWAQHWLDVVRYAESDGYREDGFRPDAYRYRDYVIGAFNDDKPYDQFVREQLAADEFAADDPTTIVATGFLRLGIYEWNQRHAEMQRELIVNEITNVTGEVFLGVGIGCARCHDHKFDPILQRDYFALQAFLSSTIWPTDRPLGTADELDAFAKRQQAWEQSTAGIRGEMDAMLAPGRDRVTRAHVKSFPANVQAMYWSPPGERSSYEQQIAMLVQRQVDRETAKINADSELKNDKEKLARYKELEEQLANVEPARPQPLPTAFITTDTGTSPATTTMTSGKGKSEVQPGILSLLGKPAPVITPTEHTTGRRLALAEWIVRQDNPFTARVAVNRIWQYHFGRGLVATPNDFGRLGEPPTHPQLLDWLASRFVEGGWRMKPLHRLIMTSATYRQTARHEPGDAERLADPGNSLLWRFPPCRLGAEQVRDAMLSVSGELEPRLGGPSTDGNAPARSIYVKRLRNSPEEFFQCFDAPEGFDSAPERQMTNTPTQALLLSNNPWPMARAQAFAKRLLGDRREILPADIDRAYSLAWGRAPTTAETSLALEFVAAQKLDLETSQPAPPPPKFPAEDGLRPIAQCFGRVAGIELGSRALWLQPTSRFEQLHVPEPELNADEFTIEAVVQLDGIHPDGTVNTLVSRWTGGPASSGWAFGVTSAQSGFGPRNLIVQLVGPNPGGDVEYEVVASNLRVPTGQPIYLAATIRCQPDGRGMVRFSMLDLNDPQAKLETAEISHNISGGLQNPQARLLIGGRDQGGNAHLWDGQVARLAIATGHGGAGQTFAASPRVLDASFSDQDGSEPIPGSSWLESPQPTDARPDPTLTALADFCHALLSSNEFLYLH